jgi:malate dehydrogenase
MLSSKFTLRVAAISNRNFKAQQLSRFNMSTQKSMKVVVLGAAGGIGQPLSMLLKLSPNIDHLACYDIVGTPGVAADISHVRKTKMDSRTTFSQRE